MKRLMRKLVACLGIAALLLMQLAVSAYSCPMQQGQSTYATDSEVQGDPCSDDADAPKSLCIYHCQQGKQSLDKPQAPGIAPVIAMGYTMALADTHFVASPAPWVQRPHLLARETEPPLSIRNCCLRI
jgi:hypothetical protein